jgi:ABC-type transport system involved in multi-copper enzyme maturation permease subunit
MIWIAWRFQRAVVCTLGLLVLVIIGVTVVLGSIQHHDLVTFMGPPCRGMQIATPGRPDLCGQLAVKLDNAAMFNPYIRVAGLVIAPLVGAMLGVLALASEVERRTVRLAWTQSISRTRWFAAKVGVGSLFVVIMLVPTAFVMSWWNGAIRNDDLFGRATYGIAGWDLVAYGLFMFALTLVLGVAIRHVGWTLAGSAVVFLAVAVTFPSTVRQHLVAPTVQWSQPSDKSQGNSLVYGESESPAFIPANAWIFYSGIAPRTTVGTPTYAQMNAISPTVYACINTYPHKTQSDINTATDTCYKRFDVENVVVYIPADQFWTLQLREGLIYLSAGLVLAGGALGLLRRIEP